MITRYLLDTGIFINGWNKWYHRDVFPGLWARIEKALVEREAYSIDKVFKELMHQDDELSSWARKRRSAFKKPTDDLGFQMQNVMREFPNFVAAGKSLNEADPYIVAQAMLDQSVVVTTETPANTKPTVPPKLPNACEKLGVKWMPYWEFLAALKLRL